MPEDVAKPEDAATPREGAQSWRTVLKRIGTIRLVLAAAFLVTLAIPATREMHVLTVRLLFRIPGWNTYVRGQPRGCILYMWPNVLFRDGFRRRSRAASAASPEAFILATRCGREVIAPPDPASWETDELLEWAAFEAAWRWAPKVRRNRAGEANEESIRDATLRTIRAAQARYPENGALWIAEACVRLEAGNNDDFLTALKSAAARPRWHNRRGAAALLTIEQCVAAGLPYHDAVGMAWEWYAFLSASACSDALQGLLMDAVVARDDPALVARLKLLARLQKCVWENEHGNSFAWIDFRKRDFYEAMAERLGKTVETPLPARRKRRLRPEEAAPVVAELLHPLVGERLTADLMGAPDAERDRPTPHRHDEYPRRLEILGGLSTACANLALFVLALLLAALPLEGPLLLLASGPEDTRLLPRNAKFWAATICAFAVSLLVLMLAATAVTDRVGLRPRPLVDEYWVDLLKSMGVCLLLYSARIGFRRRKESLRSITVAMVAAYFVCIAAAGWMRSEVVKGQLEIMHSQIEENKDTGGANA
ncbi:MAG: hypothetical protein ACYTKD_03205 [Planctomycetota bacterium]|jgi:hypothetical protein